MKAKPKERIRPVVIAKQARAPLFETPSTVQAPAEERYEIRFTVSKEVYEKFQATQAKRSHALKSDLSVERVLEKLVDRYLSPKERKVKKISKDSRYISQSLRCLYSHRLRF